MTHGHDHLGETQSSQNDLKAKAAVHGTYTAMRTACRLWQLTRNNTTLLAGRMRSQKLWLGACALKNLVIRHDRTSSEGGAHLTAHPQSGGPT